MRWRAPLCATPDMCARNRQSRASRSTRRSLTACPPGCLAVVPLSSHFPPRTRKDPIQVCLGYAPVSQRHCFPGAGSHVGQRCGWCACPTTHRGGEEGFVPPRFNRDSRSRVWPCSPDILHKARKVVQKMQTTNLRKRLMHPRSCAVTTC